MAGDYGVILSEPIELAMRTDCLSRVEDLTRFLSLTNYVRYIAVP